MEIQEFQIEIKEKVWKKNISKNQQTSLAKKSKWNITSFIYEKHLKKQIMSWKEWMGEEKEVKTRSSLLSSLLTMHSIVFFSKCVQRDTTYWFVCKAKGMDENRGMARWNRDEGEKRHWQGIRNTNDRKKGLGCFCMEKWSPAARQGINKKGEVKSEKKMEKVARGRKIWSNWEKGRSEAEAMHSFGHEIRYPMHKISTTQKRYNIYEWLEDDEYVMVWQEYMMQCYWNDRRI